MTELNLQCIIKLETRKHFLFFIKDYCIISKSPRKSLGSTVDTECVFVCECYAPFKTLVV